MSFMEPKTIGVLLLSAALLAVSGCDFGAKRVGAKDPKPLPNSPKVPTPETETEPDEQPSPEEPGEIRITHYTRIFCEPSDVYGPPWLTTIRSDAGADFVASRIQFSGKKLGVIDDFELLTSDGEIGVGLLGETGFGNQVNIYSVKIDYMQRSASTEKISESTIIPPDLTLRLERLGHKASYFGVSREYSYALLPDKNSYTVRDMRSLRVLNRISLSPAEYFTPALSENGRWAFFTRRKGNVLQQVQVSLSSGRVIEFPLHPKTQVQFNPQWLEDGVTIVWFEEQDGNRAIYAATQDELFLGQSRLITTLNNLPYTTLTSFMKRGLLKIAWTEETLLGDSTGRKFLAEGFLKILTYNPEDKTAPISIQSFSYPKELSSPLPQLRSLQFLSYSPWTNQLFAGISDQTGLMSFDINKKKWARHAMSDPSFSCIKPALGPEVILETSR